MINNFFDDRGWKMKVCIIRNSEAKTHADIIRMIDALLDIGAKPIILTRNRFNKSNVGKFLYKPFYYKNHLIANYELQLKAEMAKGAKNIFQLILYQLCVLVWLLKNRESYEIIHAFDLDAGIPALLSSRFLKKFFVYHIADFYVDSRQGIPSFLKDVVKKLEYIVISKADATIICTEERKRQIENSKPKKLYVVYNSPVEQYRFDDKRKFYEKTEKDKDKLTIGYVGTLSERRFIKEALNVVKNNTKFILKIAGFGPLEQLVKETAESCENVRYFGKINYEDALNLYAQCDVMFAMYDPNLPNHRYSAPNKVYEAMMLGKPIIVAKGTGIDKLVENERIGFSINYNEKDFQDILEYILENKQVLSEIMERSEKVFEKYSWPNMKRRIHDIYHNLYK